MTGVHRSFFGKMRKSDSLSRVTKPFVASCLQDRREILLTSGAINIELREMGEALLSGSMPQSFIDAVSVIASLRRPVTVISLEQYMNPVDEGTPVMW